VYILEETKTLHYKKEVKHDRKQGQKKEYRKIDGTVNFLSISGRKILCMGPTSEPIFPFTLLLHPKDGKIIGTCAFLPSSIFPFSIFGTKQSLNL